AALFTARAGFSREISDDAILPLSNVPVLVPRLEVTHGIAASTMAEAVHDAVVRLDLEEGEQPQALVFGWAEDVQPEDTLALAEGIRDALPQTCERGQPLVFAADTRLGFF